MPSRIVLSGGQRLEVAGRVDVGRREYNQQVILDSPVAFWPLDEQSGSTMADAVGSLDGTVVDNGAITIGSTRVILDDNLDERSIALTNSGNPPSYIDVLNSAASGHALSTLGATGTDFCVELWLSTTLNSTPQTEWRSSNVAFEIRSEGSGLPNPRAVVANVGEGGGNFYFGSATNTGTSSFSSAAINDGNIHHCVVNVTEGTQCEFFIDGVSSGTGSPSASNSMASTIHLHNVTIGCRNQDGGGRVNGFNGTIDAVAVYSRRLTAQEITTHYNLGTFNA